MRELSREGRGWITPETIRRLPKTERDLERERAIRAEERQTIIDAGYGHLLKDG